MIFRIPQGKHRSRPWRLGLWWNNPVFSWIAKFDASAIYDLGTDDQLDTNKLIGIGYLPHHHTNSARFGWRFLPDKNCIELSAYCYIDGRRVTESISIAEMGRLYRLQLNVTRLAYVFDVYNLDHGLPVGGCAIPRRHKKKLQYGLWPWFGGNEVAPQEITIEIKKV